MLGVRMGGGSFRDCRDLAGSRCADAGRLAFGKSSEGGLARRHLRAPETRETCPHRAGSDSRRARSARAQGCSLRRTPTGHRPEVGTRGVADDVGPVGAAELTGSFVRLGVGVDAAVHF